MKEININELADIATRAATNVIDEGTDGFTRKSDGPCGDMLSGMLFDIIRGKLIEMSENDSPIDIKFIVD